MNSCNVSYESVQAVVFRNDLGESASQIHGILTGLLGTGESITFDQWITVGLDVRSGSLDVDSLSILDVLYGFTCSQIQEQDFSFQLFLPDDDHSLGERAGALGEWCSGFLLGISLLKKPSESWPGDTEEILNDFSHICSIICTAMDEEDDYYELVEYVRICSQVVRTDFLQLRQTSRLH